MVLNFFFFFTIFGVYVIPYMIYIHISLVNKIYLTSDFGKTQSEPEPEPVKTLKTAPRSLAGNRGAWPLLEGA